MVFNSSTRLTIGLHLFFWAIIGITHVLVFWFAFDSQGLIARALSNLVLMAFLFYFNAWVLVQYLLEKKRYVLYGLTSALLIVLFIPIRVWVNLLFPAPKTGFGEAQLAQGYKLVAFASNLSIVLFSSFYQVMVNRLHEERRIKEKEARKKEAQLQFLRAQINPHFLFNTLNNIYSLAVEGSDKTATMVLKLSDLLRYVIYEGKDQAVPLKKELEQISGFIELFQMKSEIPLAITFEKNDLREEALIEPMILIPLVENCFKHCDFDTNKNAFVKIKAEQNGDYLFFTTINTKNDQDRQKDQTGGVGLENIRQRLELKQPGKWSLKIQNQPTLFVVKARLVLSKSQPQSILA